MVDLETGLEKLPPEERLKRLREHEARRRTELEEELEKKRKELEELEKRSRDEEQAIDELEEESQEELEERHREEIEQLEERIKEFREEDSATPESLEETLPEGVPAEYDLASRVDEMRERLDYLLHAEATPERRTQVGRDLYEMANFVREHAGESHIEESYAFNKLQEDMERLKEKEPENMYVSKLQNTLTEIIDYR